MYKGSDTFKYIIIDKSAAARKGLHAFCTHDPSLELYGLYDSTEHAVARIKPSNKIKRRFGIETLESGVF
jgi:hypothetical protein